jgi:ferredoxin
VNGRTITRSQLDALVADLVTAGTAVTAPARAADGGLDYRPVTRLDDAVLDGGLPRRSLKKLFLPPTEPLFSFRLSGPDVSIESVPTKFPPHVVLGARPCDAAGVEVLDKVMGWDYRDELWFGRREATTILSVGCSSGDEACFCGAAGGGPAATRGADLLLLPLEEGFAVEVVTPKGEAFVAAHEERFGAAPNEADVARRRAALAGGRVEPVAPLAPVTAWLADHFEDPFWADIALRCHGCGACASVCPTCHCFDIVDEPEGVTHGTRRRNWDTCQTSRFTLHASGHNPRADQNARFRQRVLHKFSIYPARFGELLCTGCGRCSRACPGGMDLPEVLRSIAERAAAPAGGAA